MLQKKKGGTKIKITTHFSLSLSLELRRLDPLKGPKTLTHVVSIFAPFILVTTSLQTKV